MNMNDIFGIISNRYKFLLRWERRYREQIADSFGAASGNALAASLEEGGAVSEIRSAFASGNLGALRELAAQSHINSELVIFGTRAGQDYIENLDAEEDDEALEAMYLQLDQLKDHCLELLGNRSQIIPLYYEVAELTDLWR